MKGLGLDEGQTEQAMQVSRAIQPALRGLDDGVQGAVLADLLSLWVAGHYVWGDEQATFDFRKQILEIHIQAVIDLIPASSKEISDRIPTAGSA